MFPSRFNRLNWQRDLLRFEPSFDLAHIVSLTKVRGERPPRLACCPSKDRPLGGNRRVVDLGACAFARRGSWHRR